MSGRKHSDNFPCLRPRKWMYFRENVELVSVVIVERLKKYLKVKGKNSRDEAKSISPKTLRKAEKSDSSIRREPISPTAERRERRAKGGGTKSRVPSSTSTSSYH